MALDPKIWGPHYWFVLHTIALNYPLHPNETSKKNIMTLSKIFRFFFLFQIWEIYLVDYLINIQLRLI